MEFHFEDSRRLLAFKGEFKQGERIALLGDSGAGKTSFLRLLAKLDSCEVNYLKINGKRIESSWRHDATFVHQHPVMFAHHNVQQTLQYASALNKTAQHTPIDRWTQQLGIDEKLNQSCAQLSGGESQRVALLRALATGRKWLLLDEPFSALDANRMLDACEVVSDYCQLTGAGVIVASHQDTVHRYLCESAYSVKNLQGRFEADFYHALNRSSLQNTKSTLEGLVIGLEHDFLKINIGHQFVYTKAPEYWQSYKTCRITISASDISLALGDKHVTSMVNRLSGTVKKIEHHDDGRCFVTLDLNSQLLVVQISQWSSQRLQIKAGQRVYAEFKVSAAQWHGLHDKTNQ